MTHNPVQRFRQRKLSTRQSLHVLRQSEIDSPLDDGSQRHIPKVETGVEKGEEIEHHLQAAISASAAAATGGKVAQIYIPTPDTIRSDLQYHHLYTSKFTQPTTYIRFSSTVEDCIGCNYCLSSEDENFIQTLQKIQKYGFAINAYVEIILDNFESLCPSNELSISKDALVTFTLSSISKETNQVVEDTLRNLVREVYDYWRLHRSRRSNRPLLARLKFETGRESDDSDPYVCFRRREVRQVRKTRGRDAHILEKLIKLRKELEDARHIVKLVNQRENRHSDDLIFDEQVFKIRYALKGVKRNLCIKGDDGDLINQKPTHYKLKHDTTQVPRVMPGTRPNQSHIRNDNRASEAAVLLYHNILSKKREEISRIIAENVQRHTNWNRGWVDATWKSISPSPGYNIVVKPRTNCCGRIAVPSKVTHLETGLLGALETYSDRNLHCDEQPRHICPDTTSMRNTMSMQRRKGRGGRTLLDRRQSRSLSLLKVGSRAGRANTPLQLRWGNDDLRGQENSHDYGSNGIYHANLYEDSAIRYRVMIRTSMHRDNNNNNNNTQAVLSTSIRSKNQK